MSAAGWIAPQAARTVRRTRGDERRLPAALARLPGFALLGYFATYTWMQMVQPAATGTLWATLLAALAAAGALVGVARLRLGALARAAVTLTTAAGLLIVALAAAGAPGELARPRGWDDLAGGIAQGLSTVPNVRVPYQGSEPWTQLVIVLGGGVLVGLAALLAFAPRRGGRLGFPIAAAFALGILYLVPVMQRDTEHQFAGGALFAVLLALFLWLERVRVDAAPLAASAVAVAVLAAVVVAPRLDATAPLLDYEAFAQSLTTPSTRYEWNHDYGPLEWPRDGSEVLRVKARNRSYWKAANLAVFDGRRWVQPGGTLRSRLDAGLEANNPKWRQSVRVTMRALRSVQFVAAGSTLAIPDAPRTPIQREYGLYTALERPLRRGNTYRADVYVPNPTPREMRDAWTQPLPFDRALTELSAPGAGGAAGGPVTIPPWGAGEPSPGALALIEDSVYARTYALAQRLRARAATPYDFMRVIEQHLARGFRYSERPSLSAVPLEEFLFGERRGYCQQFSGAMALLLRLGGVPARVATGFSPGAYDAERREYVVRDIDAHSWVEVFFPGIGWVTRDPTPSASPARSQTADLVRTPLGPESDDPISATGIPVRRPDSAGSTGGGGFAEDESSPLPVLLLVLLGVALVAGLLLAARMRRRARPEDPVDGALAELRRALTRSGRPPSSQTTLEALATRWRGTPAESYVRTLTAARFGYGDGRPTPAQRAALRRVLGTGGGPAGRLRAWWALPPRPRLRVTARRGLSGGRPAA